jgi:general secretion pathway protein G
MKANKGFTLVEILIVVVILGILAAIVIPQFTEASTEAKTSSLCTDLQTMRSQIELYKIQHNDDLPAVAGEANADFEARMTAKTDINGDAGTDYGPYLQKIPTNQFNDLNTVRIDGAAAGANTDGWRFDTTSGDFNADDDATHAAL